MELNKALELKLDFRVHPGQAVDVDAQHVVHVTSDGAVWVEPVAVWPRGPRRLQGRERPLRSVALSPNGRHLAVGDSLGTIQFWDLAAASPLGSPLDLKTGAGVRQLIFSPDGQQLVAVGDDGAVSVLPAPDTWASELCGRVGRGLDRDEWRREVGPLLTYRSACVSAPARQVAQ